jgi:hypothetical protein
MIYKKALTLIQIIIMKKTIAKLRIVGIVALVVFIGLVLSRPFNPFNFYQFTKPEKLFSLIAVASFAIIITMQLYRFYIANYYQQKGDGIDL